MKRDGSLKVGSHVKFVLGGREVQAVVVEDRGRLGAEGNRLLRVRLEGPVEDAIEFEVRAADVHLAA